MPGDTHERKATVLELTLPVVISVVSIVFAAIALWRSQFRGAHIIAQTVPRSGNVAMAYDPRSDKRLQVNVHREILFTNVGRISGFISTVDSTFSASALGFPTSNLVFGAVGSTSIVPERRLTWNIDIAPLSSARLTIGLWFSTDTENFEAVNALVRDPKSPLAISVQ